MMIVLGSNVFIILAFTFFGEIGICWCNLQEHPVVQNVKEVLDKKMVSERCAKVLTIFVERLDNGGDEDIWAIKLLDATSKVPVGLLSYNFGDWGHFQECIDIESKRENVIGKYCLGNINISSSVAKSYSEQSHDKNFKPLVSILTIINYYKIVDNVKWAMCLPSNCTIEDTILLMNKIQPFGFGVSDVICQTIEDVYPKLTTDALIGISSKFPSIFFLHKWQEAISPLKAFVKFKLLGRNKGFKYDLDCKCTYMVNIYERINF